MQVLQTIQADQITDRVRAKFAMVAPVLEATLYSLAMSRVTRLGGFDKITLHDLAREFLSGSGDAGICFEYAVHEAIATENPLIAPLASEVLEDLCGISGGAVSILFGPEKNGRIPIIESVQDALTDESRVYVGNRGHPAKLKRYIPQIVRAFHRHEARNKLPRSIMGLWKADLFLGNTGSDRWVGTTVKINPTALEGAQGLRIGIYPRVDKKDVPRRDEKLNLIRLPLPYDAAFMELYYKSFYLVRAFLRADASVPPPVALPDAEDRFVTAELAARRDFPLLDVLQVIRDMSQESLLDNKTVETVEPTAALSEDEGLDESPKQTPGSESVSLSPTPLSGS
ncbi:hypothetical protein [Geodermatophilus obscurus]|uniref:hypothetical protein n=1 Tax=Geodermatophilus obscurus TaxID=1861 RepID=UPI000933C9D2|nr:hypothetical protein [Geodermatophilus obscurus]